MIEGFSWTENFSEVPESRRWMACVICSARAIVSCFCHSRLRMLPFQFLVSNSTSVNSSGLHGIEASTPEKVKVDDIFSISWTFSKRDIEPSRLDVFDLLQRSSTENSFQILAMIHTGSPPMHGSTHFCENLNASSRRNGRGKWFERFCRNGPVHRAPIRLNWY